MYEEQHEIVGVANMPDKKILFIIVTCQKNARKLKACLNTWARMIEKHPNAQYIAVSCNPYQKNHVEHFGNHLSFRGLDDYFGCARKEGLVYQYAVENIDFDYIIKTEDDAYIHVDRLMPEKLPTAFYGGMKPKLGSFIWLGKSALVPEVIDFMISDTKAETLPLKNKRRLYNGDVRINWSIKEVLKTKGETLFGTKLSHHRDKELWPSPSNSQISSHYVTPAEMNFIHSRLFFIPML